MRPELASELPEQWGTGKTDPGCSGAPERVNFRVCMPRFAHIYDAVLPLIPELPHAPRTEPGLPPAALNAACCRQTAPSFWSVIHVDTFSGSEFRPFSPAATSPT